MSARIPRADSAAAVPSAGYDARSSRLGLRGRAASLHLAVDDALLEHAEVVDHQHALEMIELVLDSDGEEAVRHALRACERTNYKKVEFLDTLAAASAECGEYEDAVKWQRKAMEQISDPVRLADYRSRLDLYSSRKPARIDGRSQ